MADIWWPIRLIGDEKTAFDRFQTQMDGQLIPLDYHALSTASHLLTQKLGTHLADILDRDGLPHHSHLLNGWGNAKVGDRSFVDLLDKYIHQDHQEQAIILQCDPEGDFHPWQTFAYCVMAGVNLNKSIATVGSSLNEVAFNSWRLNTREGRELGHFLFALAYMPSPVQKRSYLFGEELVNLHTLVDAAIDAHEYGSFEVCRKFHLTEGICAVASKVPSFSKYWKVANSFLCGQLDMIIILGSILKEGRRLIASGLSAKQSSTLAALRSSLVIGNCIENYFYYAGHIIELAAFAYLLGFQIHSRHWNAINYVINELNRLMPYYLPYTAFADCFLHFGHYRRAMTLISEIHSTPSEKRTLSRAAISRYTANFDLTIRDYIVSDTRHLTMVSDTDVYEVVPPTQNVRVFFQAVLDYYAQISADGFELRGTFKHFRRIIPREWPRAIHYEFLDYGNNIGVEIHLERDNVTSLQNSLRSLISTLIESFPKSRVEWEGHWYNQKGRIRILYDTHATDAEVALGMQKLIDLTFPALNGLARQVRF